MTTLHMNWATPETPNLIEDAIAEHGAMTVLIAAIRRLLRARFMRRARPPDIATLDARMRRDIGLMPDIDRPTVSWRLM
jgi:hypothetical protein